MLLTVVISKDHSGMVNEKMRILETRYLPPEMRHSFLEVQHFFREKIHLFTGMKHLSLEIKDTGVRRQKTLACV